MKVLQVDKFYFIKGGAERYMFELSQLLKAHDHTVIPFSMKHPLNFSTPYARFFVENIDFHPNSLLGSLVNGYKTAKRLFYSVESRRKIERLIQQNLPDIAHLHMIEHQISPSILDSLKRYSIPIVQTVHQYKLICPNYLLFNPLRGEICEKCIEGRYFRAFLSRCHKNSLLQSGLVALETYLHRFLRIYEKVDIFLAPSHFMRKKLIEGGIPPQKVRHLFYTLNLNEYPCQPSYENYFVYYGRLSAEKGLFTLLKAVEKVRGVKLLIIGDGPLRESLVRVVKQRNLTPKVEFCGYMGKEEIKGIVGRAKFVVVPSEWYENSPLVIYESFSMGKPVIGSRIGGIPELVDQDVNGLLFEPGHPEDLAEKIQLLWETPVERIREYGRAAREKAEKEFSPQVHYQRLLSVYEELLSGQRDGKLSNKE